MSNSHYPDREVDSNGDLPNDLSFGREEENVALIRAQQLHESQALSHALKDQVTCLQNMYSSQSELCMHLIRKDTSASLQTVQIVTEFANFGIPEEDSIHALNMKISEAREREMLARAEKAYDRVRSLEQRVYDLELRKAKLDININANIKVKDVHIQNNTINHFQPGTPPPRMPKYRQDCRWKDGCRRTACQFTHPRQRSHFGKGIDNLKDYVTLETCGLPENGGM